jgi:hypothetical protein
MPESRKDFDRKRQWGAYERLLVAYDFIELKGLDEEFNTFIATWIVPEDEKINEEATD